MYPDEFDLYRARSVSEALDLLTEHSEAETELLAGGHSLLPTMKSGLASPEVLVDISEVDAMHGIEADGDAVAIGAMTTYATIGNDDTVAEATPVLAETAMAVGDRQVRNRGTIGGNIAHADPASDLPGAVIAADAEIVVEGPDDERHVPADDFFLGMYATDVADDELVTRVEAPANPGAVGAYAKRPSPSSGYAIVGVAAQLQLDGGTVTAASVGANGVMDHGVRLKSVEDALEGNSLDEETIATAAGTAMTDLDEGTIMEDPQASAAFRTQLLEVYTERALATVADQARAPTATD